MYVFVQFLPINALLPGKYRVDLFSQQKRKLERVIGVFWFRSSFSHVELFCVC